MKDSITIGQYIPGDSFVHRLDPRVKIMAVFIYIVAIFFIKDLIWYAPIGVLLLVLIQSTGISVRFVMRGLRQLLVIILITMLINFFMTPGEVIFRFGFLTLTKQGIYTGVFMALRLIYLVVGTSLLTLTTSPISLTDGLETLMKPLSKIGFPSHQLAMMMTIALRFIPTLFEETDKIMKAQAARGADFESGNIIRRAKNIIPLLVPLFINAFRRADDLAVAMEARCYRGGEGRTRLNELKYHTRDFIAYFVLIAFLGLCIASRFL